MAGVAGVAGAAGVARKSQFRDRRKCRHSATRPARGWLPHEARHGRRVFCVRGRGACRAWLAAA